MKFAGETDQQICTFIFHPCLCSVKKTGSCFVSLFNNSLQQFTSHVTRWYFNQAKILMLKRNNSHETAVYRTEAERKACSYVSGLCNIICQCTYTWLNAQKNFFEG